MISIPETAIGTIAAAFIAGIVSLLGLIISKEQKTSEFRQSWIDSLRTDLTAFLTQINAIHDATKVRYESHAEKVNALQPLYTPLNASTFSILLRVNSKEPNCKRLLDAMEAFNIMTADEANLTTENIRAAEQEFLAAAQALLKLEWKRVKSGEWTFKIAKISALVVILISLFGGIYIGYTRPAETPLQSKPTSESKAPAGHSNHPADKGL